MTGSEVRSSIHSTDNSEKTLIICQKEVMWVSLTLTKYDSKLGSLGREGTTKCAKSERVQLSTTRSSLINSKSCT
jgi:hypothetical protein